MEFVFKLPQAIDLSFFKPELHSPSFQPLENQLPLLEPISHIRQKEYD